MNATFYCSYALKKIRTSNASFAGKRDIQFHHEDVHRKRSGFSCFNRTRLFSFSSLIIPIAKQQKRISTKITEIIAIKVPMAYYNTAYGKEKEENPCKSHLRCYHLDRWSHPNCLFKVHISCLGLVPTHCVLKSYINGANPIRTEVTTECKSVMIPISP